MSGLRDRVMVVAELTLADGSALRREWTWGQIDDGDASYRAVHDPPAWLLGPRKAWDDPQDPIAFRGNVPAGYEDVARAWLGIPVRDAPRL